VVPPSSARRGVLVDISPVITPLEFFYAFLGDGSVFHGVLMTPSVFFLALRFHEKVFVSPLAHPPHHFGLMTTFIACTSHIFCCRDSAPFATFSHPLRLTGRPHNFEHDPSKTPENNLIGSYLVMSPLPILLLSVLLVFLSGFLTPPQPK